MSGFLEEWLCTRLGVPIQFNDIGAQFFDGKLFFKILQSYDVVGQEVKEHFRRALSEEEALENLNLLRVCLKLLGVLKDDTVLEEIARKNGSACIQLLNELYLRLSNRHTLPFVTKEKEQQVLNQETGRFQKIKVAEKKCILPGRKKPVEKLLTRLKTSIRLFGGDTSVNNTDIDAGMQKRLSEASAAAKDDIKRGLEKCNCKTSVEECIKKFDERINEYRAKGDCERKQVCSPDKYVKMLKLRTLKEVTDKDVETKLKDILLKKIFCQQMKEREKEFHCSMADKLLKQSKYEREMVQRLGKIHQQHQIIFENKRRIHEEAQKLYDERLQTIQWRRDSTLDKEVDKEKHRLLELHRKIYDERVAQARAENINMILNVLNDLVDISIKMSEFEAENKVTVPTRELKQWKIMFYTSLPQFPLRKDLNQQEEKSEGEESFDSYIESHVLIEETLNDHDLNDYLILLGPWAKELWPELENAEEELDVLGFVVHRLLEFKYPLPEPPQPIDVPFYPIRVILNNFDDKKALKTLKGLLEKPKIEIIEIPILINLCVDKYKKEMGIEDKKKTDKKKDKANGKKNEKKGKKKEEPKFKSVEVQFPSMENVEPPEQILSKIATMGKEALEILDSGSIMPDELTLEIITEFLKNLDDREGWVLVNFPLDCKQVDLMEFAFTGINAPIKCNLQEINIYDKICQEEHIISNEVQELHEELSVESNDDNEDRLYQLRTSKLVPRPNPPPPKYVYKPYFSRYIHAEFGSPPSDPIVLKKDDIEKGVGNKSETSYRNLAESDEKLEDSQLQTESEELQTPNSFYETTDIHLNFFYKKFDLSTLKQLGRVILNETDDVGPKRKSSIELFGDVAKEKGKNASAKLKKKKESLEGSLTVQAPIEAVVDLSNDLSREKSVPCIITEPCWIYTTPDISEEIMLPLASLWESIEASYIHNLKELFLFYREHDASVVPYRFSIFNKLNEMMEDPDNRQELVTNIQNELNSVQDTLRGNGEVKKELYCKIFELQLELWDLCDVKKNICEQERQTIIQENWMPKHICGIFNLYISMMETELDRFVDSVQLIKNYYTSSIGKSIGAPHFKKWVLPRYKCSEFESKERNSSGEVVDKKSEVLRKHSLTKRHLDVVLVLDGVSEYFSNTFSDADSDNDNFSVINITENPFWTSMLTLTNKLQDEVTSFSNIQNSEVERERKSIMASVRAQTTAIKVINTKEIEEQKKKNKGKVLKVEPEPSDNDEELQRKETYQKAVTEWSKALQNETERTIFRISLLKHRFGNDLHELLELMTDSFHSVYNEIAQRYFDQIRHCDSLLKVLMASIEAESKIEPALILTMDKFRVEEKEDSLPQIPPPPASIIEDADEEFFFSIQQLYKVMDKMKSVSSLGIIVESFIAIVEDMTLLGQENGYSYLPKCWSLLNRSEIREIIRGIYGDVVVADWKDFLLFGLNFRFPTLQEVIEIRDKYLLHDPDKTELISQEDYDKEVLWFEKELSETLKGDLRIVLGKQFLFDLYRVSDNFMNYTAFLLNYCKDEHPVEGLGKALALVTGSGYILREDKLYLLASKKAKPDSEIVAEQIINILMMDTMNWAEGIVITEVDDDGNPIKETEEVFVKNDFGFNFAENLMESPLKSSVLNEPVTKDETNSKQTSLQSTFEEYKKNQHKNLSRNSTECVVWESWVPKKIMLNLLLSSLLCYSLPESQFFLQNHIEESLSKLYKEKGVNGCIQAHELVQSHFMKVLLTKCHKFKSCDLKKSILSLANSKKISNNLML